MRRIAYAALWIYVFSVPWGGVVVISSGTNIIGRVTGGAAVGLALFTALFSGRFRRWHAFHLAALLFVVWAGCTQLYFYQGGGDRLPNKFWTYVQLLLVLWIMWELAASKQRQLGTPGGVRERRVCSRVRHDPAVSSGRERPCAALRSAAPTPTTSR